MSGPPHVSVARSSGNRTASPLAQAHPTVQPHIGRANTTLSGMRSPSKNTNNRNYVRRNSTPDVSEASKSHSFPTILTLPAQVSSKPLTPGDGFSPSRLKRLIEAAEKRTDLFLNKESTERPLTDSSHAHTSHEGNRLLENAPSSQKHTDIVAPSNIETENQGDTEESGTPLLARSTFTAHRLLHSTPAQMDQESRVLTIGPLPREWVVPAQRNWVRRYEALKKIKKKIWRNYNGTKRTDLDAFNDELLQEVGNYEAPEPPTATVPNAFTSTEQVSSTLLDDTDLQQRSGFFTMDNNDGYKSDDASSVEMRNAGNVGQTHNQSTVHPSYGTVRWNDGQPSNHSDYGRSSSRSQSRDRIKMRRQSTFSQLMSDKGLQHVTPVFDEINIKADSEIVVDSDNDIGEFQTHGTSEIDPLDSDTESSVSSTDSLDTRLKTHHQPKPILIGVSKGQASKTLRGIVSSQQSQQIVGDGITDSGNKASIYLTSIRNKYDLQPPRPSTSLENVEQGASDDTDKYESQKLTSSHVDESPELLPFTPSSVISSSDLSTSSSSARSFVTAHGSVIGNGDETFDNSSILSPTSQISYDEIGLPNSHISGLSHSISPHPATSDSVESFATARGGVSTHNSSRHNKTESERAGSAESVTTSTQKSVNKRPTHTESFQDMYALQNAPEMELPGSLVSTIRQPHQQDSGSTTGSLTTIQQQQANEGSKDIVSSNSNHENDTPISWRLPGEENDFPVSLEPSDTESENFPTLRKSSVLEEMIRLRSRFDEIQNARTSIKSRPVRHIRRATTLNKVTNSDGFFDLRKFLANKEVGEAIRFEHILVTIKSTDNGVLVPNDFNEAETIDTRILERWKEYIVVARKTADPDKPLVIQFYSSRNIKLIDPDLKPASKHDFHISKDVTAKLYSTLDKTVAVWNSSGASQINSKGKNKDKGTKIYIFCTRTHYASTKLFAFFRKCLGTKQPSSISLSIPDLTLKLDIPIPWNTIFKYHVSYLNNIQKDEMLSYSDLKSVLVRGTPIIVYILASVLKKLVSIDVIRDDFLDMFISQKVGLAWRRYDRLEWVRESMDESIHSGWVLYSSHDLEMRPKAHYPSQVTFDDRAKMEEPIPVEGFLVRLSRWNGKISKKHQKEYSDWVKQQNHDTNSTSGGRDVNNSDVNALFYKKLYFHCHDNLLFFSNPKRSVPPAPPNITNAELLSQDVAYGETTQNSSAFPISFQNQSTSNPSSSNEPIELPIVYETRPYKNDKNEEIEWLNDSNSTAKHAHVYDQAAAYEMHRRVSMIVGSDGFIDLCEVDVVRKVQRDNLNVDGKLGHSNPSYFNRLFHYPESGTRENEDVSDDGMVTGFDDDTVFEIVMLGGIVIRLQAFNKYTRDLWIKSLTDLSVYWKRRVYEDVALLNIVRQANLDQLHVDEDYEPYVGEAAAKWETSGSIAHPSIFHISRIAWARSIAIRGILYQKPNKHASFRRYYVVLTYGYLMMYNMYYRTATGTAKHRADHRRYQAISLENCYVYSGSATQSELLQRDKWFDRNHPGSHSIPRVYPDGWKSAEEEYHRCFVLWFATKRPIVDKDSNALRLARTKGGASLRSHLHKNGSGKFPAASAQEEDMQNDDSRENEGEGSGSFGTPTVKLANRLGSAGVSMVFMTRSRQERDMWVLALNTEIGRMVQSSTKDIFLS